MYSTTNMQQDNFPHWDKQRRGFYEIWYLKLNLPNTGNQAGPALWLRFTTLSLKNGLKTIAETWAIFFEPQAVGNTRKIALKNTSSPSAYRSNNDGGVQI